MIQSPIAAVLGSNPASQIMILVHYKATVSSKDTEGDLSLKFIQCKARLIHLFATCHSFTCLFNAISIRKASTVLYTRNV